MSKTLEFMSDALVGSRVNFENLFSYANDAVFVDKFRIDLYETTESISSWKALESDFLAAVGIDGPIEDRINNYIKLNSNIFQRYEEKNNYINGQMEKLEREDIETLYKDFSPLHFRLLPNFELVGQTNRYTLDPEMSRVFMENIRLEENYMREKFHVEYYKNSEIYLNLTTFFILTSACLRTVNNLYKSRVDITTKEAQILNNLLVSQGFLNFNVVPINLKSALLINLVKLYRTRGTLESIRTISRIFSTRGDISLKYLYLFFDKKKWVEEGEPDNKTGFYKFLKVDTEMGAITPSAEYIKGLTNEDILSYEEVVSGDSTWRATENELFNNGITFVKTKYFYIDQKMDMESLSIELPILSEMLAYFFESKKGDLTKQLKRVYEHVRFLDFAIIKRSNPKDIVDLSELRMKNPSENSYKRLIPSQSVLDRLDSITDPIVFIREFEIEYSKFVQEVKDNNKKMTVVSCPRQWLAARKVHLTEHNRQNYTSYAYMKNESLTEFLEKSEERRFISYRNDEELMSVSVDNYVSAYEHLSFELRSINIDLNIDVGQLAANQVFIYLLGYFSTFYAKFIGAQSSYLLEDRIFSLAMADIIDTVMGLTVLNDYRTDSSVPPYETFEKDFVYWYEMLEEDCPYKYGDMPYGHWFSLRLWDSYRVIIFKMFRERELLYDQLFSTKGTLIDKGWENSEVKDDDNPVKIGLMMVHEMRIRLQNLFKEEEDITEYDNTFLEMDPYDIRFVLGEYLLNDAFTTFTTRNGTDYVSITDRFMGILKMLTVADFNGAVKDGYKNVGLMKAEERHDKYPVKYKYESDVVIEDPHYVDVPPFEPVYMFGGGGILNDLYKLITMRDLPSSSMVELQDFVSTHILSRESDIYTFTDMVGRVSSFLDLRDVNIVGDEGFVHRVECRFGAMGTYVYDSSIDGRDAFNDFIKNIYQLNGM